jgi:hypothetical protein
VQILVPSSRNAQAVSNRGSTKPESEKQEEEEEEEETWNRMERKEDWASLGPAAG